MVDYVAAIKRPIADTTTALVGIVVGAIPVVNLLIAGFSLEAANKTLNNDNSLPNWSNIADILVKAIMAIVVSFVYMIPAMIVVVAGGALAMPVLASAESGPTAGDMSGLMAGGVVVLLGGLLAIIAVIMLPMALLHYLKGGLGKAFSLGSIIKKCLTATYLITLVVAVLYNIVLGVIAGVIAGALFLVPVVGLLAMFIVNGAAAYLGGVAGYTMFAQAFKELGA